jgi:uncharacterized membrane protein HdeD (DUF308 family)
MSAFVIIGVVATLVGLTLLVAAIRRRSEQSPKHVAMLIGAMMLTAFGIIIAGFAIVYERTTPLALNAAVPTP